MSDHYDDLRDSFRELQSLLDEFRAGGVHSEEALLALEEQIKQGYRQLEELLQRDAERDAPPSPRTLALDALSDWLVARQGTFMPDFDALYRRKAELDGEV